MRALWGWCSPGPNAMRGFMLRVTQPSQARGCAGGGSGGRRSAGEKDGKQEVRDGRIVSLVVFNSANMMDHTYGWFE